MNKTFEFIRKCFLWFFTVKINGKKLGNQLAKEYEKRYNIIPVNIVKFCEENYNVRFTFDIELDENIAGRYENRVMYFNKKYNKSFDLRFLSGLLFGKYIIELQNNVEVKPFDIKAEYLDRITYNDKDVLDFAIQLLTYGKYGFHAAYDAGNTTIRDLSTFFDLPAKVIKYIAIMNGFTTYKDRSKI